MTTATAAETTTGDPLFAGLFDRNITSIPASVEKLLRALGNPDVTYARAIFAERGSRAPVQARESLFP